MLIRAAWQRRNPKQMRALLARVIRQVSEQDADGRLGVSRHAIAASAWFDGADVRAESARYEMAVTASPFPIIFMGETVDETVKLVEREAKSGRTDIVGVTYVSNDVTAALLVAARPRKRHRSG
jgi:hypothetical protein